jgi:hypothetical protein
MFICNLRKGGVNSWPYQMVAGPAPEAAAVLHFSIGFLGGEDKICRQN